jgi:iron complex outermembrane receptor protein
LFPDPSIRVTGTYGSWNTRVLQLDGETGFFGPGSKNSFLMNIQQMLSDGYQTDNKQKRVAGYGKYQYRFNTKSSLTLYGGLVDIWTNTPNGTNPTRAQVAQFGDNYLLDSTMYLPNGTLDPYFYGFDTYHVQTDFEYASYNTDFGDGWHIDMKAYTTRYWNKQNYQSGATVNLSTSKPSGVDKLNGYRHAGDTFVLSKQSKWGIFRSGVWYDWAYTDRYQIPQNPVSGLDVPFGNFHEHFITQTTHPFGEFEWHLLPKFVLITGVKYGDYAMSLNQYQDAKIVGCLGGKLGTDPVTGAPYCFGGAQFVNHRVNYGNWLPNVAARYSVRSNWSVYAQFAEGNTIPPSNIFDVTGGNVLYPPKPTVAKTYQTGSVIKARRWTLDADFYYIHFQNPYASYADPVSLEAIYYPTGPTNSKGIETEGNILLGAGFSLYANATLGTAKYQTGTGILNGGLWVANTPHDVESFSLLWRHKNWDVGFVDKRVGTLYNDAGTINQAVTINPFNLSNLFINYTVKNSSFLRGSKFGLAINNLTDNHALVGVTPAVVPAPGSQFTPNAGDLLNLLPGRSVMATFTAGWAPKR